MKDPDSSYPFLISIVIPVKNGAPWLHDCMKGIMKQNLFHKCEIIVLDSGSTDGTIELLKQYPVRIVPINPEDFNHGETRNAGAREAKGKYVVMTVQDAVAADEYWLQELVNGFDDQQVAGVCGQQVVPHHSDKNPADWFRPQSKGLKKKYYFPNTKDFDNLSPAEKKNICGWDDVTACYRKDILMKLPFRKVSFAEDAAWAYDALRSGYSIVYNPAAKVYHYHQEDYDYSFRRTLTVLYFRYKFFGYIPETFQQPVKRKLQLIKLLVKEKIPGSDKIKWWHYNRQLFKGQQKAHEVFMKALNEGGDALEKVHEQYCKTAPMAVKN